MDNPTVQLVSAHWGPLPHHGARGAIHRVTVALSPAGVFLAITADDGPRILHGQLGAHDITWSEPWLVPVPPLRPTIQSYPSWSDFEGSCDAVHVAVDTRDPLRLAVSLCEDQGGSYGIWVGRWREPPRYVPYPFDTDLPFGVPLLLRGDELLTLDGLSSLRQYALGRGPEVFTELALVDDLELARFIAVDEAGDTLALSTGLEVLVLRRGRGGGFAVSQRLPMAAVADAMAIDQAGQVVGVVGRDDAFDVVRYGPETVLRTLAHADIDDGASRHGPRNARPHTVQLAPGGHRAVFECARGYVVLEVASGRTARIDTPRPSDIWPCEQRDDRAFAMWGDQVVVATREGDLPPKKWTPCYAARAS